MSSQTKKQSVKVPPMSTEMRFMVSVSPSVSADVAGGLVVGGVLLGVLARSVVEDLLRVDPALTPLLAQRDDVPDHVGGRRVARRDVLGLELGGTAGAVELEDPAVRRVRGERELVAVRVQDGLVDLAGVPVVDQGSGLVVAVGVAEVVAAHAAQPAFDVEVDEQVLGHGNSHGCFLSDPTLSGCR